MSIHVFLSWLLLLCAFISHVIAAIQLSVVSSCEKGTILHKVNEYLIYELVWDQGEVPNYCIYKFHPPFDEYLDYRICVDVFSFNLENCDLEVQYYIGLGIYPDKTYTCGDRPSKVCGRNGEYFDVKLRTNSSDRSTYPSLTNNFKLSVIAIKLYDDLSNPGVKMNVIVGGVIGGTAFISMMVIASICMCNHRHRARSAGQVLNTTHTRRQTNIAMTTGLPPYQPRYRPYPAQTHTLQMYPPPISEQQPEAPTSYSSIQTQQGENNTVQTEPGDKM